MVRNKKLIITNENYNWEKEGKTLKEYQINSEQKSQKISSSRQSPTYRKSKAFNYNKDKKSNFEPVITHLYVSALNSKERKINKYLDKITKIEDAMKRKKENKYKFIVEIRKKKIIELKNKIHELMSEDEKKQHFARKLMTKATIARASPFDKTKRSLNFITNKIKELKKNAKSDDIIKAQTAIYNLINIENEMGQGFFKIKRKKAKSKKKKRKSKKRKFKKRKSKKTKRKKGKSKKRKFKKRKSKKTKRKKGKSKKIKKNRM